MTLVARVLLFFLIALAIVLLGYTLAMYALVRQSLHQQFDDQLRATLQTLLAAVEVEEDDVKWQPLEHAINTGTDSDESAIRWAVYSHEGALVDHSRNQTPEEALHNRLISEVSPADTPSNEISEGTFGPWRYMQHRLSASHPKPDALRDPDEYPAVTVAVVRSTASLQATLRQVALLGGLLSIVIWLLAATAGRWYCRKALAPVRQMSTAARRIAPGDFRHRLPVSNAGDELTDLGTAFNGLLDQLFEAYERQRGFTGDAAHQLRTPLTVLQGQLEVALRRPRSAEEYRDTLGVMQGQVIDLNQMVEAMLMLVRSNAEAIPKARESIELAAWLTQRSQHWKSHPRFSDLEFIAPERVDCQVWPELLSQLLDNLIDNALKYSAAGTPIKIELREAHGYAVLSVTDQGIGISPEDQTAIFEPFFRASQARRHGTGGVGLGLSIARRIAEVLGGTMECSSTPGAGSRFSVHFPCTGT